MSKKNDLEHTSTTLGSQNMKSSQRMVSVVEPYELPEGWKWCRLPECVSIVTGKKDANYGTPDGKYLFFTCAEQPLRCDDYSFEGESLLLPGNGANVGQVIYYDGQFEVYQRTYVLQKTNESILLKYLYYHILGFWKNYNLDKQYGSATNYIKMGNFLNYHFPLPPTLAEQQRIVNRIESMFAKLDEAKEKAQNVVDGFETRKSAILHKAFTGELTAKWRRENGVSDDSWVVKTIGETMQLQAGKNISADKISLVQDNINKYPCFGGNGIRGYVDSYNKDGHFPIIGRQGALCGNLKYATGQFYATEHAVVVSCPSNIDSIWAYYTLGTMNLNQYATATAQPGLAVSNIVKISIPVPTLPEQVEIVRILDIIIEKENKAKQATEAVLEQIDLLKKSILARAFRGEL